MTIEKQMQPRAWPQRLTVLIFAACVYLAATLIVQRIAGDLPWSAVAVQISTTLLASLGVAYSAIRAAQVWRHPLVRSTWLFACVGMLFVLCAVGIALVSPVHFGVVMVAWLIAAALLFRCMQSYGTRPGMVAIMWFGLFAQVIGHAFAALRDVAQLIALESYFIALAMGRHAGLDELITEGATRLRNWAHGAAAAGMPSARPRICFPFIAQIHQMFHALPIAAAMAERYPDIDVHVAAIPSKLGALQHLIARHAGSSPLQIDRLYLAWPGQLLHRLSVGFAKILTLRSNRHFLSGFDAVVVPERTSTYLRRISPEIRLIGTEHGAGDRQITFSPQIARYDFVLLPGQKQAAMLLGLGYIRPDRYVSGVYAKLDWALTGTPHPRLFENDRKTVLYNPHFERKLSSWPLMGRAVLDFFADSKEYNLIFAPHIRMFDPVKPATYAPFRRYQELPHMLIDLGSERCVDMTYTTAADIYLGDVSSQVVEFMIRPRPCIFLNPGRIAWERDVHYRFWHLGTVIDFIEQLPDALTGAQTLSADVRGRQEEYMRDSVGVVTPGQAGARGADAIVEFLKDQA